MRKHILRTLATTALLLPLVIQAQVADWNSELTRDIMREDGVVVIPEGANGSFIKEFLEKEIYIESERWSRSGVKILERNKVLDGVPLTPGVSGGMPVGALAEYMEIVEVENPDGEKFSLARRMSPEEVTKLKLEASGSSAEDLASLMEAMADGYLMMGNATQELIGNSPLSGFLENSNSDIGRKMLTMSGEAENCEKIINAAGTNDELATYLRTGVKGGKFNPIMLSMGPACMLELSASYLRNAESPTPEGYAKANQQLADDIAKVASIGGTDVIDGQEAIRIDIADLGITEKLEGNRSVAIDTVSVWIDDVYFKQRKFRMEGEMIEGRKSKPFFMEREFQDFRRVGGSYLYEPYVEIMRVGGMLSEKDKADLAEAQKELEKFEEQMKTMPAGQRAMMEKMIGPQMEKLRSMANDGAVTMKVITTGIVINPDMSDPLMAAMAMQGGESPSVSVLQLIQGYLAELGYEPGPPTGQLNLETEIAISQFQAEKGLEVTGKPSPELARILEAAVDAL